jgi:hypothetical protein
MTVLLNGVDLGDLVMDAQFAWSGVAARVVQSLGGRPIIWEQAIPAGRPIDLMGTDNSGWLSKSVLQTLQTYAAMPKASFILEYDGETKTVRFRHEDQPVISAVPVMPSPDTVATDRYCQVVIRLMEI